MQSSGSFAYNISHSATNTSSFDSSNLYNPAFRVPEYPINPNTATSSSSILSATGGKQFQQASALLPSGTLPPSSLGSSSSSLHVSALRQHQKNNLSISSHLTLFSLSGNNPPPPPPQLQQHQQLPQTLQPIPSGSLSSEDSKRSEKENTAILNDLLYNLTAVDGSNINNFLLAMLRKINLPFTLDDFYNLLYNDRQRSLLDNITYQNKIDKTVVSPNNNEMAVDLINQLLNVFKNPNLLIDYFPNLEDKDNKLVNINYHELLRTFLAIKILYDILIQLPLSDEDDPQHYTIPRLSIYKTYYIICQKLIASYPSASNTRNEQQKLILGQSKLGKLIKLVYPDLMIKRLGSRGESKYNYLGVMWNENIVQHEIKQLCDEHDLNDLGEIFNNDHNNPFATLAAPSGATHHR
ncbi:RFX-like DNA-binding protein RFX2 [Candida viswanathii]|uniref:RFX-like DNA-binding protein RFX2 n=1 Tax=Candida viswanathii TaxID=5486 RepID=A0A367Y0E9_9ASCO|nr:RFX-like DNA-binding protein RFX2 [Candida viswanathii]